MGADGPGRHERHAACGQQLPGTLVVVSLGRPDRRGRLGQRRYVAGRRPRHEPAQRRRRLFDRRVHRHARLAQRDGGGSGVEHRMDDDRAAGRCRDLGDHRRGSQFLGGDLRPVFGVAAEVAGHEQRVGLAGVEHRVRDPVERAHVLLGAAGEIDRVGDRGGVRQAGSQGSAQCGGQLRQGQPAALGLGRGDRPVTTAVGQHRDPPPAHRPAAQQYRAGVDQLLGGADTMDTRRLQQGVDRRVVGGQRAGMRRDRAGGDGAARDRQRDDRLAGVDRGPSGAGERPAVAKVLEVQRDQSRVLVRSQGLHELGGTEIGLIAQRGEA